MSYKITFEKEATDEDVSILGKGLDRQVLELFPDKKRIRVTFFLRSEADEIVGGVSGNYGSFGWLYIEMLWVADELRGRGYGKRLMKPPSLSSFKIRGSKLGFEVFNRGLS